MESVHIQNNAAPPLQPGTEHTFFERDLMGDPNPLLLEVLLLEALGVALPDALNLEPL